MQPPTPVELETLTHVHQFLRAGHGRNMLVAVDDGFVASLADADAPVAGNALLSKLNHLSANETSVVPAMKSVIKRVAEVVPDSHDGEFMAPMCCPLTKTCMKHIADPANEYLVTEKSDGVRTVLYSEAVHNYPRWIRVDDTPAAARIAAEPLGLIDQSMLEGAWRELISDNAAFKAGLHLTVGTGKMTPVPPSESNGYDIVVLRMMANGSSELVDVRFKRVKDTRHFTFLFDRSMGATYLMLEETPFPSALTRIVLDGELILSYPPTPQGQPAPRPSCVFAVFDLLSYHRCPAAGANPPPEREYIVDASMSERYAMIQDDVLGPSQVRARSEYIPFPRAIRLMRKTMVKVAEIAEQIVAKMAVLPPPATSGAIPVSADFDARYFFLPTCSFNDGLIFTPDKFDVKAGSCPTQYKWKWPGKLSVDFLVQLASPPKAARADRHNPHQQRPSRHEDVSSAPIADTTPAPSPEDGAFVRCDVSLMFKQRGQRGQADQTGHVQMTNEYLYNPHGIDLSGGAAADASRAAAAARERPGPRHQPREQTVIPATKKQTVVECCLARGAASGTVRWRIDRVRHDKTDANAMITAFSVLESIAENITVADLCAGLGVELPAELSRRFPVVTSAMLGSALPDVPALRMILRAYSNKKTGGRALPLLQWQVRLPSMHKGSLSCNHREVRQCYGLKEQCPAEAFDDEGEQNASVLVGRALLELGNHGGCVGWSDTTCDVGFDAKSGRWVFGGISGDAALKASTWCTNVFAHLCALAKYAVTTGGGQPDQAVIDGNRPAAAAAATSSAAVPAAAPLLAPSDAHYAARTRALAAGTSRTALRRHNNWVKAVVLTTACTQAQKSAANPNALALLDLCCGRGGDLHKFVAMPVKQVMLIDSCFEAVVEAAGRYSTNKGLSTCSVQDKGVPMTFQVSDCFSAEQTMPVITSFVDAHEDVKSRGGFDIVSCQFSLHYAFSKESQVRGFLEIVSRSLRVGGIFAGTTVDDEALLSWRGRCGDSFGNHDFHVDFLTPEADGGGGGSGASEYGAAYRITVQTSVEDEVEYLVEWPRFVALCAEYKLELVETKNFDAVTDTGAGLIDKLTSAGEPVDPSSAGAGGGRAAPAHQKRPRVGVDVREEMTKDEAETAGLFRTVLLRKTA